MADKISGYAGRGLEVRPSKAGGVSRGQPADRAEAAQSRTTAPQARPADGDRVQLTGSASVLRQAEARLAGLPDVDSARVEAVRERLAAGAYEVDAERVAAKLLGFERELG